MKRPPIRKRNPARAAANLLRAYGPPARREWIKAQPSVVSGKGPCVNVHVKGGGGSRKADACWIVPMLQPEHNLLHQHGKRWFEAHYCLHLDALAEQTEAKWQAHLAALPVVPDPEQRA